MSSEGFPSFISAQLQYLVNHAPQTIKVEQVWSGCKYLGSLDRFTLLIPYCLDTIKWDVLYNADFPLAAPDVIFGPEDEEFHPFQDDITAAKNSLSDWNNKDPTRLLALIQELRDQYMSYQRKRVGEVDDDRLKFEISTMLSREGIEMHMSSGVEKLEEVKFAVPLLDMNINKMVVGCPWRYQQRIYLQVIYPVNRKYVSAPSAPRLKLMSTAELKSLFSIEDVKLPPWLDGMCMAEYLPHLEESLERQVLEAVSLIDVRRRFIEALAPLLGRPVETDSVCISDFFFPMAKILTVNVTVSFLWILFPGFLQKGYVFCCLWSFLIPGAIFLFYTVSKTAACFDASKFLVFQLSKYADQVSSSNRISMESKMGSIPNG
ncbi:BRISC and BRCA1-A complex member 2-like isoform X1 [Mangifera indica]|uniref:BRISC and BRCA1-A complex member 2-like isoform X1 n=1 Tax=Mangifera indica TaxID=29780 RepID=UPI001CFB1402|nr:BRISC and BRCA1-A complex member 2-like isoform X1 [Mangifera indica]